MLDKVLFFSYSNNLERVFQDSLMTSDISVQGVKKKGKGFGGGHFNHNFSNFNWNNQLPCCN